VATPLRVDSLQPAHRGRIAAILRATGVFSGEEVAVALELFDETFSGLETRESGFGIGGSGAARDESVSRPGAVPNAQSRIPNPDSRPPDYSFLGAFTPEDELVGYACFGPTPGTDRTYDLYWIAVDPVAHGAGIGTTLLSEVERRLQGQHARLLVVETSSRSEYAPTRGFYGRRGYTEAARVRGFYAPGDDRIILTKRFQHSPAGRGA
jgi:ribosomal protein S18 acetylase RimI-like enzyme